VEIGEPQRTITIEPIEEPAPSKVPEPEPEQPEPERQPAEAPAR
jgi:hypothetical protein